MSSSSAWRGRLLPAALAFIAVLAGPPAAAQSLVEQQATAELQEAENRLRTAQNEAEAAQRAYQERLNAFDAAMAEIEKQRDAIAGLRDAVHAARNVRDKAEPGLRGELQSWREKLAQLEAANAPPEEIENARRYVQAYENWLAKRTAGHEGVLRIRRARLEQAIESLKQMQAQAEEIGRAGLDALEVLQAAEQRVTEAQTNLNAVLAALEEKLKDVDPPWLEQVMVWRDGGGQHYDVKWELRHGHADETLKDELALIEALIEGTGEVIRQQEEDYAEWERILLERMNEAQRLNDEYAAYMTSLTGAWMRATLIELADVGVDILLDSKDFGPYAFAINAVKQVTATAYDAFMDNRRRPEWDISRLPGIGAPQQAATIAGFHTDTVKKKLFRNGLIEIVKTAAAAKSSKIAGPVGVALNGFKGAGDVTKAGFALALQKLVLAPMIQQFKDGAWTNRMQDFSRYQLPQRLFGKALSEKILGADNWQKAAREIAEGAKPPRGFMRDFAGGLADSAKWKGLAIGMVQQELKVRALEAADETRLEKWTAYMAADAQRIFAHEQYVAAARKLQLSRIALEAYQERRGEIIRALGEPEFYRRKIVLMDEVLRRNGHYEVRLIFNRDVQVRGVQLGGAAVQGRQTEGRVWIGHFDAADLPSSAQLAVDAWIETARRQLDDPATYASYDSAGKFWRNYEPGPDQNHVFRVERSDKPDDPGPPKPRGKGVSYVFVVDTSGSMQENDRIGQAKAALKQVLDDRPPAPGDETALFTFTGCGAKLSVPFTQDIEALKTTAEALQISGDTPLDAAVTGAARYLRSESANPEKVLIVLTDGEESCGGDFYGALMEARRDGLGVEDRRVR